MSDTKTLYREFWNEFGAFVASRNTKISLSPPLEKHYIQARLGDSSYYLSGIFSVGKRELRAEVVLDGEKSRLLFGALQGMKSEIEAELGQSLTWGSQQDHTKDKCRLYMAKSVDPFVRKNWAGYREWLLKNLEKLEAVFAGRLHSLRNV